MSGWTKAWTFKGLFAALNVTGWGAVLTLSLIHI